MKNIIANYLLHGELCKKISDTECKSLLLNLTEAEEELIASLSETQKTIYNRYSDAAANFRLEEIDTHFSEGFKAGALFGLQIKD